MRARPDDTHVAAKHVPKLWHFIDTEFAEPFSERINALVGFTRLSRNFAVAIAHCAEFVDLEFAILHSGAFLTVRKRDGRLKSLRDENDDRQHGKNDQHYRKRDCKVDRAFENSVQRI